jgi:hypothetical protein
MKKNVLLRAALHIAMGITFAATLPLQASYAASGDGSLAGRLTASDNRKLEGAEVTVRNPETGFTRTVRTDADGYYRFPFLPVGKYIVEARRDGSTLGKIADVTIGLGAATTADVTLNAQNIEEIQVVGTRIITAVDVKSTESATNVTREELERLPVERDIMAAALLAPGLSKGDAGLCVGGNCGVSFGGSSIAENTIYINGLNVTDFYNRVGSSSVPYSFYKEFQVKTGGYSVEFGRTTGGVINAVTRSGTNEFEFGTDIVWEPSFLQSAGKNRYASDGHPYIVSQYDEYDRQNATVYASGPILKDRLFFFALYEARSYKPQNTSDSGNLLFDANSDDGFWGAKVDWQISDNHLLELLAFSDKNKAAKDSFNFDLDTGSRGAYQNTEFTDNGGLNWAATYTGYLTDSLSLKALYGKNERKFSRVSSTDIECNRIRDRREVGDGDVGCSTTTSVTERTDDREAARLDFEWALGEHQLRFGMDREVNTSNHDGFYPGTNRLLYEIFDTDPGSRLDNGGIVPAGVNAYVRTRQNEVSGEFETLNSAYYLEDNWSVVSNLVLNAGVRVEAFDNKNSDGDSYIKMDNMVAPRFGFSWDVKGDSRSKIFGNAGRYFLPVANVINIKQAGGFLDERTFYVFQGLEPFQNNGQTYQRPILGPQIGGVDDSQGDGTVGDLRGEVDADMDPVYQDELILGFQAQINDKWSWGVRGIYRKLNNAIDDMNITSNGILCGGEPTEVGFVMGNPGRPLTVYTDTNCDGESDAYVTIDTARGGWARFYQIGEDRFYIGDSGYPRPTRTYKALEFVIDRAWDDTWSFNAAYTLSFSKGNAEGPVNSDTDFADTGRTEAFDNPWVNYGGSGYLPNDHRHQLKLRGAYALTENWEFGTTLNVQSGRPVSAFGVGDPFDAEVFHTLFVCTANCDAADTRQQVYELRKRGSEGTTPWTYDLGVNVTFKYAFSAANLRVRLAAYNLFNQQRTVEVDDEFESSVGSPSLTYGRGTGFQTPRYAVLQLTLDF